MSDLHDLLALEAQAQTPAAVPPFGALVRRRRRRHRIQAGLGVLALAGAGALVLQRSPGSQIARLVTTPTPTLSAPITTCRPRDLVLSLAWEAAENGALKGTLSASNPTDQPCLLLVKPFVQPDGMDGTPLPTQSAVTMERLLGPDELLPGATATAPVGWYSWCGAAAGRTAHVSWASAEHAPSAQVSSDGLVQPACSRPNANSNQLSASWFTGLSDGHTAKVSGLLQFVGGPEGVPARGVAGTVTLTDSEGFPHSAQAGEDGRFTVEVPAGFFYTATATSPSYNGGSSTCGGQKVYVPGVGLTDLTVACQLK